LTIENETIKLDRDQQRKRMKMRYIVLDLEWNQSRHPRETVRDPVHLVGEIIQIGAVRLKRKYRIGRELRINVAPKFYKKLHQKVSQITGLSEAELKKGKPFPEAAKKLMRFCGKDFFFFTWGPEDVSILRDNFILHGMDPDQIPPFYDLQVIFAKQIAKDSRQYSLSQAIQMLGEKEFDAHDALNDAHNTALICKYLDLEEGLRHYALYANEITVAPVETKDLSVLFEGKQAAMRELTGAPFLSSDGLDFITVGKLIPQNAAKYLALAKSDRGEEYLVRFRFFKNKSGKVRASRELFPLSDSLRIFYQEKEKRFLEKKPRSAKRSLAASKVNSI